MKKHRIPCGRTEADIHLCCKRRHKWYNTVLVIERIRLCKNPIKRKRLFVVQSSTYCIHCRSVVTSAGGCSLAGTIREYLFGHWF